LKTLPEGLDESDLIAALAEGWGLGVSSAQYRAVGFGSYHWVLALADGTRRFITVDDLDHKGFLGNTRETAFDALRCAFDSAIALRDEGRLEFVVSPHRALRGDAVRMIGSRYALAVFPFLDGTSRGYSEGHTSAERVELAHLLVRLHHATPLVASTARPSSLQLPGRHELESALQDLNSEWTGGPFSEKARALLARDADAVVRLVALFDDLSEKVIAAGADHVITHGEPHAGNVVRSNGRLVLVDWDTVALALPERDLWMVDSGTGSELRLYEAACGRRVNQAAIDLYRIRWRLDDIASFVSDLRSPHEETADMEHAWISFARSLPA
jgi:spectinomycin phosphotransferase